MNEIFISYSRKDKEFVLQLQRLLTQRDRQVWVDWQDIPPTAEWLQQVYSSIEAADCLVFILSPDSVSSKVCSEELAHALARNKKLIPVLCREVDLSLVPDSIAQLNWIVVANPSDWDVALEKLLTAIDTDLVWTRQHTRLLVRATEWDRRGRHSSLVLHGRDLVEGERWLGQGPEKEPKPTKLQTEFIIESRHAASRRQTIIILSVSAALALAIALAIVAFIQYRGSEARRLAAQGRLQMHEHVDLALLLGVEANAINDTPETRGALLDAINQQPRVRSILHGDADGTMRAMQAVALNGEGLLIAGGGTNGEILIWDAHSHSLLRPPLTGHRGAVTALAFSRDGQFLASGASDGIRLWNVSAGFSFRSHLAAESVITALAFSPVHDQLASSALHGELAIWDLRSGRSHSIPVPNDGVTSLAYSPDGRILAAGSDRGDLLIFDAEDFHITAKRHAGGPVRTVSFSHDGKLLATAGDGDTVRLWSAGDWKPIGKELTGHRDSVRSLAFHSDDKLLVSGSFDATLIVWDVTSQSQLQQLSVTHDPVWTVAFGPDDTLAEAAGDNITLWDAKEIPAPVSAISRTIAVHADRTSSVAFSHDGKLVASGSFDNTVQVHDVASGAPIGSPLHGLVNSLAFAPYDTILAYGGGFDHPAFLWDAHTKSYRQTPATSHKGIVSAIAFGTNGKVAASYQDGTVFLWDPADANVRPVELAPRFQKLVTIAFSADGAELICGGDDKVLFWSTSKNQQVGDAIVEPQGLVKAIALSPDGTQLAIGNSDWLVEIWDVSRRKLSATLVGHTAAVTSVGYGPDGILVSSSEDGSIMLWDTKTKTPLIQPFVAHAFGVTSLAVSVDPAMIVSGDERGRVVLSDMDVSHWRATACKIANRNLTEAEWRQYRGRWPFHKTCNELP